MYTVRNGYQRSSQKAEVGGGGDVSFSKKKHGLKLGIYMYENRSRSAIAEALSCLDVPDQICDSMVDNIVADALRTAKRTGYYTNCIILHLAVDIFFHVVMIPYFLPRFEPASKSAIDELEKARVEVSTMCSVCLETMVVGFEASRMPCLHLYHGGCIVKWLGQSRFCPLCRFSLPADESIVNVT